MTWHYSVELPALLPERLLHRQLLALLVEVLQLDPVFFLRAVASFVESLELRFTALVKVTAFNLPPAQLTSLPHHFQCIADALTYK